MTADPRVYARRHQRHWAQRATAPDDAEVAQVVELRRVGIELIVAIGGNDTAETALRLAQAGGPRVVTVPKTIDNDLPETDHCPGYGSIARLQR